MILAATVIVLAVTIPASAADKDAEKTGVVENERGWPGEAERMNSMMEQLKELDPNQAAELEKLRATNPEAYKETLKNIMRERFEDRPMQRVRAGGMPEMRKEMMRERLRDRADEYLEWLKANYPDEAERMADLKKAKPELYKRQLIVSIKKYGRIAEASKDNPELAKVLKKDLELRNKSFDLLLKLKTTSDEAEKQKLTTELEQMTSQRFDVILKRKQLEYDQLRQELDRLQEQVRQNELQLEKWKQTKNERVAERVKELLSRTEKFEWE